MIDVQTTIQRERYGLILRSISRYKRITRSELAKILKVSSSALVKYIKTLINAGIISETDQMDGNGGGRRSVFLEYNPKGGSIIGVAIYRTYIDAGILAINGDLLDNRVYPCPEILEKEAFLAELFGIVEDAVRKAEQFTAKNKILAIGVAMGGHLDASTGISYDFMFARHWRDVPLKKLMEERFGLPLFLIKDTNACALGEQYYGNGIGIDNFLSVWLGSGVGLGIVIDGKNYTGASGYAGEIGHTRGEEKTAFCYCGHTGCLESRTSQEYILAECRKGLDRQVRSSLRDLCEDNSKLLSIGDVIRAANEGDRFSMNVFSAVGKSLGDKLSDIANIFNPELISLRGPVIDGNDFLFETIRRIVIDQSLREITSGLTVMYSTVDERIHLKGICGMIVNELAFELGIKP
jgi:N-acetylglucosamine repressor